ncbi:MAG: RelA/SpoT family protein [Candidatus Gracilibacteria bacterium]
MIQEILEKIRSYNGGLDSEKIGQAFELIKRADLYNEKKYFQSLGVVYSLLPMNPDAQTVIAAILYALYEEGVITDEQVSRDFGQEVVNLLGGVRKLGQLNYRENDRTLQLEALRKMFLTMAKDIRVVLVKLATRLYKMAHLSEIESKDDQLAFARETFDVYVPVASRLGIYRIKIDLEDLAFMYLDPEEYARISKQIEKWGRSRKIMITMIRKELERFVSYCGCKDVEVVGRLKSVYSIYKKLREKNLNSIEDLYDIFAMRLILPSQFDEKGSEKMDHLYNLLGMIHSNWKPITKKFKDYVAVPKPNGYQSLHTVVLGLVSDDLMKPVEIQVRSYEMHRHAEYGVASHWIYKQRKGKVSSDILQYQVEWLKGLEQVHEDLEGNAEVMKKVEVDIFRDRIFVLTPRGEIKDLPVGSVSLDFAYAVHTDVGNHCIMAKVNGSVVTLDHELRNGDVIEIIVKKDSLPKLQWLSMVKTNFAKNKIRNWFNKLDRENNVKQGRLLLNKQLEKLGLPSLDQNYSILKSFDGRTLTVEQRETLVEEVGRGYKAAGNVIKTVYPLEARKEMIGQFRDVADKKGFVMAGPDLASQVLVGGEKGLPIKLGACCGPSKKDDIIGYVTRGNRITIHNAKCVLLPGLDEKRMLMASWREQEDRKAEGFSRVKIKISTLLSRVGLIRDVSMVIASFGLNIVDIKLEVDDQQVRNLHLIVDFPALVKFDILLKKLGEIQDVINVVRED